MWRPCLSGLLVVFTSPLSAPGTQKHLGSVFRMHKWPPRTHPSALRSPLSQLTRSSRQPPRNMLPFCQNLRQPVCAQPFASRTSLSVPASTGPATQSKISLFLLLKTTPCPCIAVHGLDLRPVQSPRLATVCVQSKPGSPCSLPKAPPCSLCLPGW